MVMWRFGKKKLLAEFIEDYFDFSRGKDGWGWREWAIASSFPWEAKLWYAP